MVVVLGHNFFSREILYICLLFTIFYESVKQITRRKKVLIKAIYPTKKPAEMPGEGNDSYGHSFQSEAEDCMVPLKSIT